MEIRPSRAEGKCTGASEGSSVYNLFVEKYPCNYLLTTVEINTFLILLRFFLALNLLLSFTPSGTFKVMCHLQSVGISKFFLEQVFSV